MEQRKLCKCVTFPGVRCNANTDPVIIITTQRGLTAPLTTVAALRDGVAKIP